MSILERLRIWARALFAPRSAYRALECEDLPDALEPNTVYLIGDAGRPWSAALICPCGCRDIIRLSLVPNDRPRWSASVGPLGLVSLHPSIWRVKGCRSHFFIRRGRVLWSGPDVHAPVMPHPPGAPSVDWKI